MRHHHSIFPTLSIVFFLSSMLSNTVQADEFNPSPDWKISAYLWTTSLDGTMAVGPIEADLDLSFSDLFESLDIGGAIAARRDWGANMLVGDLTYMSLSPDDQSLPLDGSVSSNLKLTLFSGHYGRKWGNDDRYAALLVGARYMQMDLSMTLSPSNPMVPGLSANGTPSFTDFLVGGMYGAQVSEKWNMFLQGDFGFGGSNNSYTAQLLFQRQLKSGNRINIGARALSVDFEETPANGQRFVLDASMVGLIVGFTWD